MSDFNARVGKDQASWKRILGSQGVNGLLLLRKCAEHELCITNTVFRQADKFKTTWMHPRSKQWHFIDYTIVRQRDLRDVCITRAICGAECWTDHRLIRAVRKLHIAPAQRKRPKAVRVAFDIAKLKKDFFAEDFKIRLMPTFKTPHPLRKAQKNGISSRTLSMKQPSPP